MEVDGIVTGAIGRGLVVLLGVSKEDGEAQVDWMVPKIVGLRIFEDEGGKMNYLIPQPWHAFFQSITLDDVRVRINAEIKW